ncbi:hypothetical protein ColTof3_03068 [Colletotrichum tofieldiae]|nr:hypothetical protein ColTof3_03068 [Colletotrichum tofieldiae]
MGRHNQLQRFQVRTINPHRRATNIEKIYDRRRRLFSIFFFKALQGPSAKASMAGSSSPKITRTPSASWSTGSTTPASRISRPTCSSAARGWPWTPLAGADDSRIKAGYLQPAIVQLVILASK